jgi:hypothetical protein
MNRQLFQYHPTIGYQFIPGLQTREEHEGGGFLLRTNRAGFRCRHEFVSRKRPGTFRVLLFGDSYTAGMGVSDAARYGDVVERLLPDVEVYNFGLPGSGTDQQYLIHREYAAQFEHDLVVIAAMVENIRRVASRYRDYVTLEGQPLILAKPYFTLEADASLRLHHVPVPKAPLASESEEQRYVDRYGRLVWLRQAVNRFGPGLKDLAQRLTRYQPLPAYDKPDDPAWRLMKAILVRWSREARAPVVIVPVPLYQYVEKSASARAYQARFRELADLPGVTIHDPLPEFHRHTRAQRRGFRFVHDCHLTPSAHRVLGESLAHAVRALLPVGGSRAA